MEDNAAEKSPFKPVEIIRDVPSGFPFEFMVTDALVVNTLKPVINGTLMVVMVDISAPALLCVDAFMPGPNAPISRLYGVFGLSPVIDICVGFPFAAPMAELARLKELVETEIFVPEGLFPGSMNTVTDVAKTLNPASEGASARVNVDGVTIVAELAE